MATTLIATVPSRAASLYKSLASTSESKTAAEESTEAGSEAWGAGYGERSAIAVGSVARAEGGFTVFWALMLMLVITIVLLGVLVVLDARRGPITLKPPSNVLLQGAPVAKRASSSFRYTSTAAAAGPNARATSPARACDIEPKVPAPCGSTPTTRTMRGRLASRPEPPQHRSNLWASPAGAPRGRPTPSVAQQEEAQPVVAAAPGYLQAEVAQPVPSTVSSIRPTQMPHMRPSPAQAAAQQLVEARRRGVSPPRSENSVWDGAARAAAVIDALHAAASAAVVVRTSPKRASAPPLCPTLVLPHCEAWFAVSMERLLEGASSFPLIGLSQNPLLYASVQQDRPKGGHTVNIAMTPSSPPLASVRTSAESDALEIVGIGGGSYGFLTPSKKGVYILVCDGAEVLSLLSDESGYLLNDLSSEVGATDPLARASRCLDASFANHLEMRVKKGVDAVLVICCVLGVALFGRADAAVHLPESPVQ